MSEEDIAKGTPWNDAVVGQLRSSAAGIICLTPENITAPWILFESGALSNSFQRKELVCPFLVGLQKADVKLPLAQFQLTVADKRDTKRLIETLNATFSEEYRATPPDLDRRFEMWWPELERDLGEAINFAADPNPAPERTADDMMLEVLETVRDLRRGFEEIKAVADSEQPPFLPETRVRHPQFGIGTIKAVMFERGDWRASVKFDASGWKTVVLKYAKLTPVEEEDAGA